VGIYDEKTVFVDTACNFSIEAQKMSWNDLGNIANIVTIIAAGISLITVVKAFLINKEVKKARNEVTEIKNEILRVKKEHLFDLRIREHKTIITNTKNLFNDKRKEFFDSQEEQKKKIFEELQKGTIKCESTCRNLLEKVSDEKEVLRETIQDLCDACLEFQKLKFKKSYEKEVTKVSTNLYKTLYIIDEIERDRRGSLS
jgi:hypothetical protein